MKKILFIDRDGTMIDEAPPSYQIDSFDKLKFYPEVFRYLGRIAAEMDFELVLVSNQDGLGTSSHPFENFQPVHDFIMNCFANEGIVFSAEYIDKSFPHEGLETRKPGIGM
ncbi:MAG: bifunctional histidinol-phosphatase/imidazoleglycerol-phosphate dehydratase, partial [Chitinophagaceae bacterium]